MDSRYTGKKILIACSMIEDEVNAVLDRFDMRGNGRSDDSNSACPDIRDIDIWWQERGYHNDPDELREVIQGEITRAEEEDADTIMLAYGLCGKGAAGWRTEHAVLAMPRFDDCCNIMLCTGRREKRNLLEAGNMYLTRGWSRDEGALLSMLERAQEKYGERRGLKVMKLMFDSYTRVTVIDTGCYELEPVQRYAEQCAGILGLESCTVPGSNNVLGKLITGDWDEDIIVKLPGDPVREEDFDIGGVKEDSWQMLAKHRILI